MRLIMIRHPRTEANERKLVYGRMDAVYSESGKASIPGILEELRPIKIDKIYTSPLTRTRLLAEAIAADHVGGEAIAADHVGEKGIAVDHTTAEEAVASRESGEQRPSGMKAIVDESAKVVVNEGVEVVVDDRIIEMNFGMFEEKTIPELEQLYPEEFGEYRKDFNEYIIPEGESFRQLYQRTVEFLEDIYEKHEGKGEQGEGQAEGAGDVNSNGQNESGQAEGAGDANSNGQNESGQAEGAGDANSNGQNESGQAEGAGNANSDSRKEQTIVVVSHSMVIHAALGYLLNLSLDDVWKIRLEPGSMADFDWRYGYAMLQGLSGPFNVREIL